MYMTIALVLLGILAFTLAAFWRIRQSSFRQHFANLQGKLGISDADISGDVKYTYCVSHQWVLKNVVFGSYSKSGEALRDLMMNNTLGGTILIGLLLGVTPMVIALVFFNSMLLAGSSVIVIIIAVFLIRSPGGVATSYDFLKWQQEQDIEALKVGDFAYAKISQRTIQRWTLRLILIGIISLAIAPWGDQLVNSLMEILISDFKMLLRMVLDGSIEEGKFARSLFHARVQIFTKSF
ncbi:MAG: hypothetical protein ACFE7R_06645, partial [Candidatus Hodarchaeota archaeon]